MRTFKSRSIVAAATLGIIGTIATNGVRADMPQMPTKLIDESAGFYVGAGVGRSDYVDGCSTPGTVTTNCDTQDTAWKAYGGYQLNRWLSAEAAYIGFGNANYSGINGATSYSAQTQTWGATAEGVAQIPIPLDNQWLNKVSILGKLGTIYWDQRQSGSPSSDRETGWGLAWGFGLQYTFSEHIGIRAEWEQFDNVGTQSTGGRSDIQMWTVGVNYKF